MTNSTDTLFAKLLDTPEYPKLAEKATALARRRGFDSLASLLRSLLASELQKSEDVQSVSRAGQNPDDSPPAEPLDEITF